MEIYRRRWTFRMSVIRECERSLERKVQEWDKGRRPGGWADGGYDRERIVWKEMASVAGTECACCGRKRQECEKGKWGKWWGRLYCKYEWVRVEKWGWWCIFYWVWVKGWEQLEWGMASWKEKRSAKALLLFVVYFPSVFVITKLWKLAASTDAGSSQMAMSRKVQTALRYQVSIRLLCCWERDLSFWIVISAAMENDRQKKLVVIVMSQNEPRFCEKRVLD